MLVERMDYCKIKHVTNVVASSIVLHNMCEACGDTCSCDPAWIHQDTTPNTVLITPLKQHRMARAIRDNLKEYLFQNQ